MRQVLSQNAKTILLPNASHFLLQNATILLQTAAVITNCDVYYKCVNTQYKVNFLKPFSKCVVDSPQKKKGKEKEKELFEIIT